MTRTWVALLGMVSLVGLSTVAGDWQTDFEKAKAEATKEGKFILVDFSGSDWCGWCIKLENEVFSKTDFKKYAKDNLVLMLADFPKKKTLPKQESAQNQALRSEFKVRGYPTVVLLLPDGTEVARTGYKEGGAEAYVKHLEELLAPHQDKLPKPAADDSKGKKSKRPSPLKSPKSKDAGQAKDAAADQN
jgi:thioredoxin-related protein